VLLLIGLTALAVMPHHPPALRRPAVSWTPGRALVVLVFGVDALAAPVG
jgi:hypothetical protein